MDVHFPQRQNRLLGILPSADRALLAPDLEEVHFEQGYAAAAQACDGGAHQACGSRSEDKDATSATKMKKAPDPIALALGLALFIRTGLRKTGGAKGIRTPDLLHAMQTRYQLRHSPAAHHRLLRTGAPRKVERS